MQAVIKASKATLASGRTAALAALEEKDEASARLDNAQKAHQKAKERHALAINAELVSRFTRGMHLMTAPHDSPS